MRHSDVPADFDDLLDEVHDLGVLDALCDLVEEDRVPDRIEIFR